MTWKADLVVVQKLLNKINNTNQTMKNLGMDKSINAFFFHTIKLRSSIKKVDITYFIAQVNHVSSLVIYLEII